MRFLPANTPQILGHNSLHIITFDYLLIVILSKLEANFHIAISHATFGNH